MAYEHLRKRLGDPEEVLNFLEKASENFDRLSIGKKAKAKEVYDLDEVSDEDDVVYVRDLDVTLSRRELKGSENIAELISRIESELGGEEPIENVVKEVRELARYLSDPETIKRLPLDILAELFRIAQELKKEERSV